MYKMWVSVPPLNNKLRCELSTFPLNQLVGTYKREAAASKNHFSLKEAQKPWAHFYQMKHGLLERELKGKKMEENGTPKKMVNRRLLRFPSKQSELNWGWRMTDSHVQYRPSSDWSCWQRVNGARQQGSPWPGVASRCMEPVRRWHEG